MFAAAVLGLAFLVRRRQPRLGLWAGALCVVGLLGLAAVITIDGYTWGVLGEVYQRRGVAPGTAEIALHEVQQSELVAGLLPARRSPGSSGSRCSRSAPRGRARCRCGPACCWRSAALMVGVETAVISNAYFIAAAAVLAAGSIAVGRRDRPHERRRRSPAGGVLIIPAVCGETRYRRPDAGVTLADCWIRNVARGRAAGRAVTPMSPIQLGHRAGRALPRAAVALALACLACAPALAAGAPSRCRPGFEQTTAISGLNEPTDIEIAPDGRVFVAEKSGYDPHLRQPLGHDARTRSPTCARRSTTSPAAGSWRWRSTRIPGQPYVYVYYTLDAPIGGTPPTFGNRRADERPVPW